jgi:hypothetical protein
MATIDKAKHERMNHIRRPVLLLALGLVFFERLATGLPGYSADR